MCQDLEFARYAVQADLLPTLFHAALEPVALVGFPSVDRVVAQWHSAVGRLVEASHGTHYCHEVKGGQHAAAAQREAARAKIAQPPVVGVRVPAAACLCAAAAAAHASPCVVVVQEHWNSEARLKEARSTRAPTNTVRGDAVLDGYAGMTPPLIDDGSAATLSSVGSAEEEKKQAVSGANASATASAQLFQGAPEATLAVRGGECSHCSCCFGNLIDCVACAELCWRLHHRARVDSWNHP